MALHIGVSKPQMAHTIFMSIQPLLELVTIVLLAEQEPLLMPPAQAQMPQPLLDTALL